HRSLSVLLLPGKPSVVSRSQRVSPGRERNRLSQKLHPIQSRDLDSPRRTVRADLPHQADELLIPLRTLVRLHPDSPRYLSPDQIQTMQGRPSVELGEDLNHGQTRHRVGARDSKGKLRRSGAFHNQKFLRNRTLEPTIHGNLFDERGEVCHSAGRIRVTGAVPINYDIVNELPHLDEFNRPRGSLPTEGLHYASKSVIETSNNGNRGLDVSS